ncbi:MAG TPA: PGPGW domain-containing protein [Methylomirabilota bacterium]|jgi:uncharacterized protein YqgC (DUF456 family)|nr:PGPGW domain-containing protein [Methylomirabilota bacterium]
MTPQTKKILQVATGIGLIIIGFAALVTPFTPGSWLIFVGLELLGIRVAFWEKLKSRLLKRDK